MSSFSNKEKRQLTCPFCPRFGKKKHCTCKAYWKQVYRENRDEILKKHRDSKQA